MNFDPTVLEAIVAAVMMVLGAGAGAGYQGRRARMEVSNEESSVLAQLTTLAQQQAETTAKIAEITVTLERLMTTDLEQVHERSRKHWRAHQRLAGDFDAVSDALDILVTHIGEQLPEQARRSVHAKLQRRQRHEVTGLHQPARY